MQAVGWNSFGVCSMAKTTALSSPVLWKGRRVAWHTDPPAVISEMKKRQRTAALSMTLPRFLVRGSFRQVLESGGPLPLFPPELYVEANPWVIHAELEKDGTVGGAKTRRWKSLPNG